MAYALLVVAWFGASPPGAGPDEYAYSLKADAAGRGVLVGEPVAVAELAADPQLRLGLATVPRLDQITRAVVLPADLVYPPVPCFAFQPGVSATCARSEPRLPGTQPVRVLAYMQAYPPFLFVTPGLLTRLAGDRESALWLARAAATAVVMVLLALAIVAASYRRHGVIALMGVALALTPVALSTAGVLGSSGAEIAAAIVVVVCALRLADGERAPSWLWLVLGAAGVVLALSRTLGPVWLALDAGLWLGLAGGRAIARIVRGSGPVAVAAVGAVVAAAVVSV
ncbi:MAG: DUF2142 domain-containing protein, partial [Candidatus Dormibacteraeota bacterium]|nr:DUF2142 domain-containing protein [Candidatus Dormibacteraeota bacterium]